MLLKPGVKQDGKFVLGTDDPADPVAPTEHILGQCTTFT